jgi:glycosyltransferase involved in cell wall biosynthesis
VGLLNVLKALAPRYQVDALTLRTAELPYVEKYLKARMLRVPVGHGTLSEQVESFRRAIRRQLEGEEYEAVHLRSAWGGRAVLEHVQAPCKIVYEVARSTEGEPRAADAQLAAELAEEETACLKRADLVLVPTETARQHLASAGLNDKVSVVSPGVDVDHFDWEPPQPDAQADRVLYTGRVSAGRGVRLLLEAVSLVKAQRPIKLLLAGPVEESFRPQLDEALARYQLGANDVEVLGAIEHDDVPRLIAQVTVCVAPSSPDASDRPLAGFPTKMLEYLACRRPVVAPRRASVLEVVTDERDALLFDPGSALSLSAAITRLLDGSELRDQIALSGYERVRREHPASATRRGLLESYARVLPPSQWSPPSQAASPIDALPAHPDTTTARRAIPDGMAQGDRSGEIVISDSQLIEIPVKPGEIVIEAVDFEAAGEPFDTGEAFAVDEKTSRRPRPN